MEKRACAVFEEHVSDTFANCIFMVSDTDTLLRFEFKVCDRLAGWRGRGFGRRFERFTKEKRGASLVSADGSGAEPVSMSPNVKLMCKGVLVNLRT